MAAGFTVEVDKLDAFKTFLAKHIADQVAEGGRLPSYTVDAMVAPSGATIDLVKRLSSLEPFGAGNDEPKVVVSAAQIVKSDIVGNGHVRCIATGSDGGRLKAIAFNCTDSELGYALLNTQGRPIHLAGSLREDTWQGRSDVQLVIEDAAWVV